MRLLLDTHAWLWLQTEPERFDAQTLALLADPRNTTFLSAASAWEMAIKYALGKLPLPHPPAEYVPRMMARSRTTPLPVDLVHALHVATLPPHHTDPFDRILISQATVEDMPIVTADRQFARYGVDLLQV